MKIKDYFILGLIGLVVILFILRGCNKPIHNTTEVHFRDTIIQSDTIIDTLKVEHTKILAGRADTLFLSDTNNYLFKYYYPIKDSLLEGTIEVKSNDRPEVDFKYKLFNKEVTNTITIKDSTYVKEIIRARTLYLGLESDVHPFNTIYLGLDYADRKGNLFGVSQGYDFINQYPVTKISYKRKINFKKN